MAREENFEQALREAMDHFNDLSWLGNNSPLAAPYFLGNYLVPQSNSKLKQTRSDGITWSSPIQASPEARGKALQDLLRESVRSLPSHSKRGKDYYTALIELRYIKSVRVDEFSDHLPPEWHSKRPTYFNHIKEAIQLLEEVLVEQINPSLRLEPTAKAQSIIGRDNVISQCSPALDKGKKIRITGPSGIGKTTLAANLADQLSDRAKFWFTFRRGLNDNLENLLFSLAFFLHQQGASEMWLQLVADQENEKETVDNEIIFGLLRYALQRLDASSPILCFDEIDALDPKEKEHEQILTFLNSLPENIPVLFLGQRVPVEADIDCELTALSKADIRDFLIRENINLSGSDLISLEEFTKGNPRLLVLYITLHNTGETLSDVLNQMTEAPSLEALLHRIWPKLHEQEQLLLQELSVYRGAAPDDRWSDRTEQFFLHRLLKHQLVQIDEKGGVSLLSAYRTYIHNSRLSPERYRNVQEQAAHTRAIRAEYTESAYHWIEANQPELGVRFWYPHQRMEINQGQAAKAYALFDESLYEQMAEKDQEILSSIRSSLALLRGEYASGRRDLSRLQSQKKDVNTQTIFDVRGMKTKGDIDEITGDLDAARLAYAEGLGTVTNLLAREAIQFHLGLGWLGRREMNASKAWHETQLAEYEIEHLRGEILWTQGEVSEAKSHFLRALALAKDFNHVRGEAKTANMLANVLAKQEQFEQAMEHWKFASQKFKELGKLSSLPSVYVNQATGYMLADRMKDAIPLAEEALKLFKHFGEPHGIDVAHNTLAEAHLAVGNLEDAEHYVAQVLGGEDEYIIMDGLRILAEIDLARQSYAAAERYGQQSLELAKEHNDRYIEGYARRVLGKVYKAQERLVEARTMLEEAINIFIELELENEAEKTLHILDAISTAVK